MKSRSLSAANSKARASWRGRRAQSLWVLCCPGTWRLGER